MKIHAIETITPVIKKHAKKGVAMAAGVALGLAAVSAYNNAKQVPNQLIQDELVINNPITNTSVNLQKGKEGAVKGHEFNSVNDMEKQGKTKHFFAAKNGPDKGSKYYRSSEYNFFGYYKG